MLLSTKVSQAQAALVVSPSVARTGGNHINKQRPHFSCTRLQSAQGATTTSDDSTSLINTNTNNNNNNNNNNNTPVQAILFDVDGTLADSWKLGFDATQVVLERNHLPSITAEIYHEGTRYSTPDRLARHAGLEPGHVDYERIGQKLGREFDDFYVSLVSLETAKFYPGIANLLQKLPSHVKLGALTNAAVRYADAVLQCNCPVYTANYKNDDTAGSIYTRFGSIRGADNVPKPKPAPDGLLTVCQDLLVDPQNCVYVGDSPTDGMAARAANMRAVGVTWGSHKKETIMTAFDDICDSVVDLETLLMQLVVTTDEL